MAIGTEANFQVYQDQFQSGVVETLTQNVQAFNGASSGAISLSTVSRKGDYVESAFYKAISGLVSRRDTSSTSAATDQALSQDEFISVKLNRKIGPVNQTMDAFRKIQAGKTDQELSFIIGQQAAVGMSADMLNSALLSAGAAVGAQSDLVYTVPSSGTLDTASLVHGLAKFGDRAGRVVCWVMHSKVYFDLVQAQIAAKVAGIADSVIRQALPVTANRPVIVTDSSGLAVTTGSGSAAVTTYLTLGLVAGAASVENSEQEQIVIQQVTGNENLSVRLQGEFAYNLGLKGFKWDVTNGAANPTDSALGTGSNWDMVATSLKDLAGVCIKST